MRICNKIEISSQRVKMFLIKLFKFDVKNNKTKSEFIIKRVRNEKRKSDESPKTSLR